MYVSDRIGEAAEDMLDRLRDETGVQDWIGSVGVGVLASGVEYFDEPAVAVMLAALPAGEFQVFSGKLRPPPLGPGPRAAPKLRTSRSSTATRRPTTCRS